MRNLKLIRILEFYDIPQIFIAKDAVDINYLCLLYDHKSDVGYLYLGRQISFNRLDDYIKGHIDLRSIYTEPEIDNSLYSIYVKDGTIKADLMNDPISDDMLPEQGYFNSFGDEEDEELIYETTNCGYPVIRLGFEDINNSHDIDAICLSRAVNAYQSMITNCHKKIRGKEFAKQAELRIVSFQAASFDVHFRASVPLDLFGSSDIDGTFKQIDSLLKAPNDDVLREKIRYLKGHTISSYKSFIETLLQNRLSVKYKWVSSVVENQVISNYVDLQKIEKIYSILLENQTLSSEDKVFKGVFLASSVENGKWIMKTDDDGININGESINSDILSGIIIEQKKYKIKCTEIQEQNVASLKITKKLILENIKEM